MSDHAQSKEVSFFSFVSVYLNAKNENDKLTPSKNILIK